MVITKYLRKFNEDVEVSNLELIEMLKNINDILIPYRDDSEYIVRIANVNINHTRRTQGEIDSNIVVISDDVEKSLECSSFYDWKDTPISVEIIFERLNDDTFNEILDRLNEEYSKIFLKFFGSIISYNLELVG
jgi:hypothetical protein